MFIELAGIAEVEIALVIEHREIRSTKTISSGSFPGTNRFARPVQLDQCAQFEVANEQILAHGKTESKIEASEGGNRSNLTFLIDFVDLAEFAACPKVSVSIKCQSFGMVEPIREDFEFLQ